MIIGISQPTFLPWCGSISLIDYVDEIVFLDNVQFDKRSWQQRNNIKTNTGVLTLTVPVVSKNLFHQKISDVKINYSSNFQKKMVKSIIQNYSNTQYFNRYSKKIFSILDYKHEKLIDLNLELMSFVCKTINIDFNYSFSSELNLTSSKGDLIIDICKKKNANKYVSTYGSKSYLKISDFKKNNIKLNFFKYLGDEYKQLYGKFIENLSILDLLFNIGPNSKEILRKNFEITETE
jgi:hypothetical protein